jgi:hypothetical protein
MRAFLLCLTLVACGGGAEAGDAPLSDSELRGEILAEADRINSCETVTDCEAKQYNCGAVYVSADADQSRLDELLAENDSRMAGLGCDTSCQCGVLLCEENKCVTQSTDCMTTPPEGMMVCL